MLSERLNHTTCVAQGCDGMCVQERFSAEVPQALYIQWHTHHLSLVLVDCVRKAKQKQGNFVLLFCKTCTLFSPAYLSMPLSLKSKVNLSNHNSQLDLRNTLIRDRHAIRLGVSSAKKTSFSHHCRLDGHFTAAKIYSDQMPSSCSIRFGSRLTLHNPLIFGWTLPLTSHTYACRHEDKRKAHKGLLETYVERGRGPVSKGQYKPYKHRSSRYKKRDLPSTSFLVNTPVEHFIISR